MALTLRLVGGLTVEQIARGLLKTEAAIGRGSPAPRQRSRLPISPTESRTEPNCRSVWTPSSPSSISSSTRVIFRAAIGPFGPT